MRDTRALVPAVLATGERVTLCGSHELMVRRSGAKARSVAELRDRFGERRSMQRRATGEIDELAANLTAAFTSERRTSDRRTA